MEVAESNKGEPEASAPGDFSHSHPRPTAIYALVAVHLLLAIAPLSMALIPFSIRALPLGWALASISYAQVMLLSMWIGMTRGRTIPKILLAITVAVYSSFWSVAGWAVFTDGRLENISSLTTLQPLLFLLAILAMLSFLMAGASRLMRSIRFVNKSEAVVADPGIRFSLCTILAILTSASVVLGLTRLSNVKIAEEHSSSLMTAEMLLAIVVFALNLLTIILATLGAGPTKLRLFGVLLVAVSLGFSMAIGAGNSPFTEPWWIFAELL